MERQFHLRLGPLAELLLKITLQRQQAAPAPAETDRLFSDAIERQIEQRELHAA